MGELLHIWDQSAEVNQRRFDMAARVQERAERRDPELLDTISSWEPSIAFKRIVQ